MPYYNKETWEHYSVDLSKYAGQKIYVAVRHTVKDGLAAFFDDFYFEHFTNFGGVDSVNADNKVTVYPNPTPSRKDRHRDAPTAGIQTKNGQHHRHCPLLICTIFFFTSPSR